MDFRRSSKVEEEFTGSLSGFLQNYQGFLRRFMDFRGFREFLGEEFQGCSEGFLEDVGNVSRRFEIFQGPSVEFKGRLWGIREVF